MTNYNTKTWKMCGNCECWTGPRKPNTLRNGVEVDSNAKGECFGQFNKSQRVATTSCSGWKLWGVIDK